MKTPTIVKMYVYLISVGERTIDTVPKSIREEVRKSCKEEGIEV